MLPPSVPKLRISGEAMVLAASERSGNDFWTSADSMISDSVVAAPMVSPLPPGADALELRNRGDVDQGRGQGHALAGDPVLEDAADDVAAAGQHLARCAQLVEQSHRLRDGGWFVQIETFHSVPLYEDFLRAARTRALVSGMSSTHTPMAL